MALGRAARAALQTADGPRSESQATVYKGRNRDTAWYAAIDGEWPALRGEFERWLAPANFDATGAQRTSLAHEVRKPPAAASTRG